MRLGAEASEADARTETSTAGDVADGGGLEELVDLVLELLLDGLDLLQVDTDLYQLVDDRVVLDLLALGLYSTTQRSELVVATAARSGKSCKGRVRPTLR